MFFVAHIDFVKVPFPKYFILQTCRVVEKCLWEDVISSRDEFVKVPQNGTKFALDLIDINSP